MAFSLTRGLQVAWDQIDLATVFIFENNICLKFEVLFRHVGINLEVSEYR